MGRVACTAKQGAYENPKDRRDCFNFEGIQNVEQKKVREKNLENISHQIEKNIGSIAGILSIWVVFLFYQTANRMYESNMDAFWWLNKDAESLGRMMHWGIPLIILLTCVANLWLFFWSEYQSKYILLTGSDMMVFGTLLWFGRTVWSEWSEKHDNLAVFYRIFRTYSERIGITIFVGIILFMLGCLLKYMKGNKS